MSPVASLLLQAALALASEPSSPVALPVLGTSLGTGRRVTARVTFDRRKAEGGGWAYAAASTSAKDSDAIRLSEAVITTAGGLLSHAAVVARAHRVPAAVLRPASWREGPALEAEAPVFGAPRKSPEGFLLELVEGTSRARIVEGSIVSLSPADGILTLYGPEEGARELALSEALRAYDGLKDAESLVHWVEARAPEEGGPRQAERLRAELAQRALDGSAEASDVARIGRAAAAALPPEARRAFEEGRSRLLADLSRTAAAGAAESKAAVERAGTRRAVERVEGEALALGLRLSALAKVLGGRPSPEAERSLSSLKAAAAARRAVLGVGSGEDELAAAVAASGAWTPRRGIVPGALYKRFLAESGLAALLPELASDASLDLRGKSERIRRVLLAAPFSKDTGAGRELLGRAPDGDFLLVSLASGTPRLVTSGKALEAAREAWADWWGPEELGRRKRAGEAEAAPELSIEAVQPAAVSGVLLTRDPVSGSRDRLVVESVFGEGDGLAGGEAAADQYVLEARTGRELLPALLADKREKWVLDAGRGASVRTAVPEGLSLVGSLSPERLKALARLAGALEDHFGRALEVDFAFSGERLLVRGTRPLPSPAPITGVAGPSAPPAPAADVPGVRALK